MCRPDHAAEARLLQFALVHRHWPAWIKIPQLGLLAFLLSLSVLVLRFVLYRKPVESGCFWALLLTCRALQLGGTGKPASVYFATAALVLVAAVIETSYLMANRKSTRLNSSHRCISYAVFCLK